MVAINDLFNSFCALCSMRSRVNPFPVLEINASIDNLNVSDEECSECRATAPLLHGKHNYADEKIK